MIYHDNQASKRHVSKCFERLKRNAHKMNTPLQGVKGRQELEAYNEP